MKIDSISALKSQIKSILLEKNDIKSLKEFLKTLEDLETVNFQEEIHKIKEKIKLIVDVKNIIENENQIKQSIEMLEQV